MIYSDDENRRWWNGLTLLCKRECLDAMGGANSQRIVRLAEDVHRLLNVGAPPSPAQLQEIRKWERR